MSGWFYQMLGEEFGPVSAAGLKQLIADGMLEASDLVRPADSSDWIPVAKTALMDSDTDPSEVLTDLSELNFRFEESGSGAKPARGPAIANVPREVPEEPPAPLWFHQFFGQVLGPIPLTELVQLAESGSLNAGDAVRCGVAGEWQSAGDVPEVAAALLLNSGGDTTSGPRVSAAPGRSLFASAAADAEKAKALADAERARLQAASAAVVRPDPAATPAQPTPAAAPATLPARPAAAGKSGGRRGGKKAEEQLVDNILSEVFAETPARPETPAAGSAARVEPQPSSGEAESGTARTTPAPPPARDALTAAAGAGSSAAAVSGSSWSAGAAPRPTLSSPAPARAKSSGSKSGGGGFSMPGGSGIAVAVLVLVAIAWFSYGPINRMLTIDEPKYIKRMEESLAALEKFDPASAPDDLYKLQDEIYREFNQYIREMHTAGATTGASKKCLAALNRLTEITRIHPQRNAELRKKLIVDAKQMISDWKSK